MGVKEVEGSTGVRGGEGGLVGPLHRGGSGQGPALMGAAGEESACRGAVEAGTLTFTFSPATPPPAPHPWLLSFTFLESSSTFDVILSPIELPTP